MDRRMVVCPDCGVDWPWVSEQGAAIDLIHQCISCLAKVLAGEEGMEPASLKVRLDSAGIIIESTRRLQEIGTEIEPCPRCFIKRDGACPRCAGLGTVFYERLPHKDE